jgi:polyisoprenoid-binding protein YceI
VDTSARSRTTWRIGRWLILIAAAAVAILAGSTLWSLFKPPQAASGPIEAIALAATIPIPTEGAPTLYTVTQDASRASFAIDEVLRGDDVTVTAATSQIAAELSLDLADPASAQLGTVLVNARDLVTGNTFRDRAIKNEILLTDDHEFVRFEPTELTGMPDAIDVGETYQFEIVGELTIAGSTRVTTFDAAVTAVSEEELRVEATTTLTYADFGITIPFSQAVEAVADTLTLEVEATLRTGG